MNWFSNLKDGLQKTRKNLVGRIKQSISGYRTISPDLLEEVEELLVTSDIGIETSMEIIEKVKARLEEEEREDPSYLEEAIKVELRERLRGSESELNVRKDGQPTIILVMGVNGSGKTTTIAKMGKKFSAEGKRVVFAAADTFRAAAIEQLEEWANRVEASLIRHDLDADPSAVAYDALEHTLKEDADVLLVDTAGRLQTRHNLMQELAKIDRVLENRLDRPVDERLLTLDATNGQNGISQAEKFNRAVSLTGIALTKLDSTAKGGVIFPIVQQLGIPIKLIGVGEREQDLHQFEAKEFIEALFE